MSQFTLIPSGWVRRALIVTIFFAGASGCDPFGERGSPVVAKRIDDRVSSLATGADRRLVLVSETKLNTDGTGGRLLICAEPSPDTAEALAATFEASLRAQQPEAFEAQAQVAQAVATSVSALTRRTQGLQLFRDGVFALCQGSMNGLRREEDGIIFKQAFDGLVATSAALIREEMNGAAWNKQQNVTINTPSLPSGIGAPTPLVPGT